MAPIGHIATREIGRDTMERARARARSVPDLLIEARRVANTVFMGWHGRRKRGVGENFWQFRQYEPGENLSRIDWRRSARSEQNIFVQDKEWQATHTVWLWADESPSMLFKSSDAIVSKQSRALVLAFAMAELLAKSGERVGWLGLTKPILSRHSANQLAEALIHAPPQVEVPQNVNTGNRADIILLSDFLDPLSKTEERLKALSNHGLHGHIVQLIDPAEYAFPYSGRVEFNDPETGEKLTVENAQGMQKAYVDKIEERSEALRQLATSLNWSYVRHHTNKLASEALTALHMHLGERS